MPRPAHPARLAALALAGAVAVAWWVGIQPSWSPRLTGQDRGLSPWAFEARR